LGDAKLEGGDFVLPLPSNKTCSVFLRPGCEFPAIEGNENGVFCGVGHRDFYIVDDIAIYLS